HPLETVLRSAGHILLDRSRLVAGNREAEIDDAALQGDRQLGCSDSPVAQAHGVRSDITCGRQAVCVGVETDRVTIDEGGQHDTWDIRTVHRRDARWQMRHLPPLAAGDVERDDLGSLVAGRVWSRVDEGNQPTVRTERDAVWHEGESTCQDDVEGQSTGWAQRTQTAAVRAHEEDTFLFRRQVKRQLR